MNDEEFEQQWLEDLNEPMTEEEAEYRDWQEYQRWCEEEFARNFPEGFDPTEVIDLPL